MRNIALIDQASVYAYSREPLTVVGTFPGSANQGVYCVSCTGVAPRERRLTRKQPWDDDHQVMRPPEESEYQSNMPTFARLDGPILPRRFPADVGGRQLMGITPP
jgi:hypothetical protein